MAMPKDCVIMSFGGSNAVGIGGEAGGWRKKIFQPDNGPTSESGAAGSFLTA